MKPAQLDATRFSQSARARLPYARKTVWSRPNFLYRPRNVSVNHYGRWFKVPAPSTALSMRFSSSNINGLAKPRLALSLVAFMRVYAMVWNNQNAHLATLRTLFWFYTHAPQPNAYYAALGCPKRLIRPRTYSHTLLLGSLKQKLF